MEPGRAGFHFAVVLVGLADLELVSTTLHVPVETLERIHNFLIGWLVFGARVVCFCFLCHVFPDLLGIAGPLWRVGGAGLACASCDCYNVPNGFSSRLSPSRFVLVTSAA